MLGILIRFCIPSASHHLPFSTSFRHSYSRGYQTSCRETITSPDSSLEKIEAENLVLIMLTRSHNLPMGPATIWDRLRLQATPAMTLPGPT
jgi:hypothetical protein